MVKLGFSRAASTNFKFRADHCNSKLVATFPNDGEMIYYSNPGAKIHYFLEFNSYKIIIFSGLVENYNLEQEMNRITQNYLRN